MMMLFTSCKGAESTNLQDPVLASEIDSLNFTYGLALGHDLKINMLSRDSVEQRTKVFMKGFAEGSKAEVDVKPGISLTANQLSDWMKQQKASGLLGDSTLKVDYKLFKQGLINGLKKSEIQMTSQEASEYINKVMSAR